MITQTFKRGCGHEETLTLDEADQYHERRLACIARTRCKECVQKLKDSQAAQSKARKEAKHQRTLDSHRRYLEHQQVKTTVKPKSGGGLTINLTINIR